MKELLPVVITLGSLAVLWLCGGRFIWQAYREHKNHLKAKAHDEAIAIRKRT